MKKISIASLFLLTLLFSAQAQDKVTEKKLLGTWELIIDIEEEMDEAREEMDEEDNIFGELVLGAVSGLVEGIMENIDIRFQFNKGGELVVLANAFEEDSDEEYIEWMINRSGELKIIGDTDNVDFDDDDYWLLDGNRLLLFEDGELEENVFLRKIE